MKIIIMDEIRAKTNENRAFIFDMDGTLVDNMEFHSQAWMSLFESLGIHLEADEFKRRTAGKTNTEILLKFTGRNLTDEEIQVLSDQKENFYRDLYRPYLKATTGLLPFLEQAKEQNIPLGLATAAGKENIAFVLQGLKLEDFFSAIVGAEDIQKGKPDPEIFIKSATKLHVQPEDCIVFEDSLLGIEAAQRAGMRSVFIATSHQLEELGNQPAIMLAVPDFSVIDIKALV
jgi:beta-phosphoglucomutase family hydrolase